MNDFVNEPLSDFTNDKVRESITNALENFKKGFGNSYPLIIGKEHIETSEKLESINPSNISEKIGYASRASEELADRAVRIANETFKSWKNVKESARATIAFKAKEILKSKKFEFAALLVYEAGKNWIEADADVAEAIDFLEFYGREMLRYAEEQPLVRIPDEKNELFYIPLGVGIVIPPWNFPLAILVGMTTAAFVTGNTVVLKPSSEAPVIAYKFMQVLKEAGLPDGVVNYLPGQGSKIGNFLVSHPLTRFISFTGSKDVGLKINEVAAKTMQGQIWIKRVIAEMGGKDTIIVDETADLDSAAIGIVASSFGYSGQKCSACSRVVAIKKIYDDLLSRVLNLTSNIKVDEAYKNPAMGPVINKQSYNSILSYIDIGKKEGRLSFGGEKTHGNGFFITPTIFRDIAPNAVLAQEEIFGPVVAFIEAEEFKTALEIANNTEYGLTGSLYSKDRERMMIARRDFHVGNLYLNRKCTGALVGVHPFGGFNMSGTDSKAGSRDYLSLFLQAKCVSERIL